MSDFIHLATPATRTTARLWFSRSEWVRLAGLFVFIGALHLLGWGLYLHYAGHYPQLVGLGFDWYRRSDTSQTFGDGRQCTNWIGHSVWSSGVLTGTAALLASLRDLPPGRTVPHIGDRLGGRKRGFELLRYARSHVHVVERKVDFGSTMFVFCSVVRMYYYRIFCKVFVRS